MNETMAAGWFSDPERSGGLRWWDGSAWTDHRAHPRQVGAVSAGRYPVLDMDTGSDAVGEAMADAGGRSDEGGVGTSPKRQPGSRANRAREGAGRGAGGASNGRPSNGPGGRGKSGSGPGTNGEASNGRPSNGPGGRGKSGSAKAGSGQAGRPSSGPDNEVPSARTGGGRNGVVGPARSNARGRGQAALGTGLASQEVAPSSADPAQTLPGYQFSGPGFISDRAAATLSPISVEPISDLGRETDVAVAQALEQASAKYGEYVDPFTLAREQAAGKVAPVWTPVHSDQTPFVWPARPVESAGPADYTNSTDYAVPTGSMQAVAVQAPVPERVAADTHGGNLLEFRQVCASYGTYRALFDVSFAVPHSGIVALLGANGAGKSTVARVASGLVAVTSGQLVYDHYDITKVPANRIATAGLTHVPEGRAIFSSLTVEENLILTFRQKLGAKGISQALAKSYDVFPILAERRRQIAGTLSGGQQRMLSLARVVATPTKLVVVDELSLGLAPVIIDAMYEALQAIRAQGTAVLVVEQQIDRALAIADHAVLLSKGSVAWQGAPSQAAHAMGNLLSVGTP